MNRKPSATRPQLARSAEPRHRLRHWVAAGLVPPDLAPCAIAAAHARVTGKPPARDRQTRIYARSEVLAALAELERRPTPRPAPPPPPTIEAPPRPVADPLAAIWWAVLERLAAVPATRMLLLQQARLVGLGHQAFAPRANGGVVARVSVKAHWLAMVASRRQLVAQALAETLTRPVAVELVAEVGR